MKPTALLSEKLLPLKWQPAVVAAFQLLQAAQALADSAGGDPWTFAVARQRLRAAGSSDDALHWLLAQDWLAHRLETTPSGAKRRRFQSERLPAITERSCFMLSAQGMPVASTVAAAQRGGATGLYLPQPLWKPTPQRELWVGSMRLHQYAPQAVNQTLLLTAIQEGDWAEWQDNPLSGSNAAEHLRDAVHGLNRNQYPQLLVFHFHSEAAGAGVTWEWLALSGRKTLLEGSR